MKTTADTTENLLQDKLSAAEGALETLAETSEAAQKTAKAWMQDLEDRFTREVGAAKDAMEAREIFAEPVKLWEAKRKKHDDARKEAFKWYCGGMIVSGLLLLAVLGIVVFSPDKVTAALSPSWCNVAVPPAGCGGFSLRGMLVTGSVLTIFTLLLAFTRLSMKEYLAERHLALDAQERTAFAASYMQLLASGDTGEEVKDQRAIVYGALFRPSHDGIVKEEGGLDPSIAAALSKLLTR